MPDRFGNIRPDRELLSGFGELVTVPVEPVVYLDAISGLTDDVETFTGATFGLTGTATVEDRKFKCTSGTGVFGYGTIRSRRQVTYYPGQASRFLFTARFSTGVNGCYLFAGAFTSENAVGIGWADDTDGNTQFGAIRQTAGKLEIRTLTISAAASGAETATLTLAGTEYTISVTAGTIPHNAFEIVDDGGFSLLWEAYQNGNTIVFIAKATGVKTDDFTLTSTGTLAGTFAQNQAGAANVAEVYPFSTRVSDTPPTFSLDHTKLNVYRIDLPWLGAGAITFWVMNPRSGGWDLLHEIQYPNTATIPSLTSPVLNLGWAAASLGSTTDLTVEGCSACGQIVGFRGSKRNSRAVTFEKGSVATTALPAISIRVRDVMNDRVSHREIVRVLISVANESSSKAGRVEILRGATLSGEPNWSYVDETDSCIEVDTSASGVSGGTIVGGRGVSPNGDILIDLNDDRFERDDVLTVTVRASAGGSAVTFTGSVSWEEV